MIKPMDVCHQSENDTLWWISPIYMRRGAYRGICILTSPDVTWSLDEWSYFHRNGQNKGVTVVGHMPLAAARAVAQLGGLDGFIKKVNEDA